MIQNITERAGMSVARPAGLEAATTSLQDPGEAGHANSFDSQPCLL